jgi:effector-binding domain-containing protein
MKALRYVLIGLAVIVVAVILLGIVMPKEYKVERSVSINASEEVVMSQIRSLRNMHEWSPWAEYDPNMKVTYTGNDGETGSAMEWKGNKDVGSGRQQITDISQNKVETKLNFLEPWESESNVTLTTAKEGEAVKVTWAMSGSSPFPMNALSAFMNMDKMIGKDFEKGLSKLKTRCESMPADKQYRGYTIEEMDTEPRAYISKKGQVAMDKIGSFYQTHFPAIFAAVGKSGMQPAGSPSGIFFRWDEKTGMADLAAAIPVSGNGTVSGYESISTPGGKTLMINYYGAYEKSGEAHYAIDDYMKEKGLQQNQLVVEEYVTDPIKEPDTSKWLTKIYYFVK